jgi:cytochrome b561
MRQPSRARLCENAEEEGAVQKTRNKAAEAMTGEPAAAEVYDRLTIILHWLTAALVVLQWIGAHYIDAFPRGPLRVDARSVHIVVGVTLLAVVVARIGWRRSGGRVLDAYGGAPIRYASRAMHALLYVALAGVLAAGVANAWVRGDSIFGLFHLPSFAPGDKALRSQMGDVHSWLANTLLVAAGLHALAGLVHGLALRDRILARMIPWGASSRRA